MSFADKDTSVEAGQVYTLYLITYGDQEDNFFAYTDIDQTVIKDGVPYQPTTIGRGKIEDSGGPDRKTLEIDITPNSSLVKFYRERNPTQVVTITIWQGHLTDPDEEQQVVWKGRILSVEEGSNFAKINAEPISSAMKRTGLRRHFQRGCPFVLYGDNGCGADPTTHELTLNPLEVGVNFFEVAEDFAGSILAAKYVGGYVQWNHDEDGATEIKTILSTPVHETTRRRIVLNGKAAGMSLTTSVLIRVGCNHRRGDCLDLHNNIENFGGQPFIPRINPLGYINRFY